MPIYEYFCSKCGKEFELIRPVSEAGKPTSCPQCKGEAQKLVSVFASKVGYSMKVPEKVAFRKLSTAKQGKSRRKG